MYFPMAGTLKGKIVPEENRSAIYNIFRVPLNAIVVVELVMNFDMQMAFAVNSMLLLVAVYMQSKLIAHLAGGQAKYSTVGGTRADLDEFGLDDSAVEMGMPGEPGANVIGSRF